MKSLSSAANGALEAAFKHGPCLLHKPRVRSRLELGKRCCRSLFSTECRLKRTETSGASLEGLGCGVNKREVGGRK